MTIDLTCPAEIFRTELPTEEIPAAGLLLYNLSDRVISSAEATLRLRGAAGEEREKVVYRARALNGRPHSTFTMMIPCTADPDARSAEAVIEKVWFADNAVWRRDPAAEIEYIPNQLPVSQGLTALKYIAGETAVGFPSQQDGLWVCVCGRPNSDREAYCARCRREKQMIFTRYNREAVELQLSQKERRLELDTRNAREDTLRLQRIREEEYNQIRDRRKRRIRTALAGLAGIGLAAGAFFGAAPALQLVSGNQALEEGRLEEAEAIYTSLGSFGNAEAQLKETRFRKAGKTARESEDPAELDAAAEALRALGDREDAAALADEAGIKAARILLDGGDWAGARERATRTREGAPGREALLQDCLFAEAKEHLDNKEFTIAREQFLELGSYEGAADLAAACVYEPALQLIEDGAYDEAIAALTGIINYQDSRTLILKCHYLKGMMLEKAGDPDGAAAEYLLAADWDDAREKAMAMVYAQAEAALAEGDIAKAAPLYSSIPDYPGAQEKSWYCLHSLAVKSYADTEYLRTLELLSTVPDEYEDTAALRKRSAYRAGLAAMERKEWETAAGLMEQAGDEKDAADRLAAAREAWARERMDQGDLTGAENVIRQMDETPAREALEKRLTWLRLKAQAENGGDPKEILEALLALGDYAEAKETIASLYYTLGESAAERNEALTAADYYTRAGKYLDAEEKAKAQYDAYYGERDRAIREAMRNGEYALAVTLLESLNLDDLPEAYAGLKALYPQALYEAGAALYRDGKVYEALPYFRAAAPESRQAANRLKAPCYLILGSWTDREGNTQAEFREDGSCTLAGEELAFRLANSYSLETGPDAGHLESNIRISDLTENHLGLRDLRSEPATLYSLNRASGDGETAGPAETGGTGETGAAPADGSAPEDGSADSFTVVDGE